jgi:hypothetical protein
MKPSPPSSLRRPLIWIILESKDQFKRRFSLIARFTRGSHGWSLLDVLLLAVLATACLTKGRAEAASNANHSAVSESDAAPTPLVNLIVSGNPIHLSSDSQQKLAQQVEAIVRSSEIVPIGPIIRSIQVDYGPDQIKATGSYLHIVYPAGKYPTLGKDVSLVKEIFLGLADNNNEMLFHGYTGGSYPGYPGSIALVSSSGGPFSDFSARSSAENGDLLIALGLNPDLHPHLTAKMQATVDSVSAAQKGDVPALKKLVAQGIDLKSITGPDGSLLCY